MPERFARDFPVEMVLRPSQLRSAAAEIGPDGADAFALRPHYATLRMPVTILSGTGDRLLSHADQAVACIARSPAAASSRWRMRGHMLHHIRPRRVLEAVTGS